MEYINNHITGLIYNPYFWTLMIFYLGIAALTCKIIPQKHHYVYGFFIGSLAQIITTLSKLLNSI